MDRMRLPSKSMRCYWINTKNLIWGTTDSWSQHKNKNCICTKHMNCLNTASDTIKYAEFTPRLDWEALTYVHSPTAYVDMFLYIFNCYWLDMINLIWNRSTTDLNMLCCSSCRSCLQQVQNTMQTSNSCWQETRSQTVLHQLPHMLIHLSILDNTKTTIHYWNNQKGKLMTTESMKITW